jgi:hypothetical protein
VRYYVTVTGHGSTVTAKAGAAGLPVALGTVAEARLGISDHDGFTESHESQTWRRQTRGPTARRPTAPWHRAHPFSVLGTVEPNDSKSPGHLAQ